jgi:hypothetical protein
MSVSHEEVIEAVKTIKKYCRNGKRCQTCVLFDNKYNDFCGRNFLELPCDWNIKVEE